MVKCTCETVISQIVKVDIMVNGGECGQGELRTITIQYRNIQDGCYFSFVVRTTKKSFKLQINCDQITIALSKPFPT